MDNNSQTPVLNALFNRLPNPVYTSVDKKANFRSIEKIKKFDVDAKLSYLKTNGNIADIKVFLENVPNNQWSILIDKLIDFFIIA
ncbi:MAG: hypothetical protein E6K54_03015 [Gammaproteobacteria bacterium]|nr:MAG: hypothetical protein E6K54_03015 [Gammaproteobacteria bacterium]